MPMAPALYQKGTVRLLHPVVLPDDHPMTVFYDEPTAKTELQTLPAAEAPNRPAPAYPEDYPDLGEDTYEYVSPPPEIVGTVKVRIIDVGVLPPPSYRDEE